MHNLFYVPPHQPRDTHPRPLGVKTVVKRNQPTRLEMSPQYFGVAQFNLAGDVTLPARKPRLAGLRKALGGALIRMGRAVTPDETTQIGQPV